MMKLPEFCVKYGVSRSAVYREISASRLRVTHIGRSVRIKVEDAEAWAASLPTKGGEAAND
ncbi:MAG: helix-turn-helix domain-containing protein [Erythrobacter sp.]|uniref:helix-turn-helix domain-containing protein n=1 Tax=Erythrobacter sp. TaxID=1042 RepID=UPI0032674989